MLLSLGLAVLALAQAPDNLAKDRATLIEGVDVLSAPGAVPGPMIAAGSRSFVVLAGGDAGRRAPLFVAGHVESGRVVAGGHESFFGGAPLKNPGNARFLSNALAWLAGRPIRGVKVGSLDMAAISDASAQAGAVPMTITRESLVSNLPYLDVICMTQGALDGDAAAQAAVMRFVKSGHGLLIAGPAWGWQSLHGNQSLRTDHTGNRMLLPYGLGFADGSIGGPFSPAGADDSLLQTDSALAALKAGGLKGAEVARATDAVQRSLGLSQPDSGLTATIARMAAAEGSVGGPTADKPVTASRPFSRLEVGIEAREMERLRPEEVRPHPSAAYFPGAIPANARRVTRSVQVDTSVPAWHGTSLYAAPGEVVTITVPGAAAGILGVRVGSHTDGIWGLDRWERFPEISRYWTLRQTSTKIASPFGGLIYIDVPNNCRLGTIDVTIEHAVLSPRFVRGKMSNDQWHLAMAEPGAPWVDLEGKLVILTVPRSAAATIKDPEALMAYWDEVMTRCYELYAAPRRPRPERYCVDHQISAGYMHSGYPIMTFEDVAETFCNVEKLRSKGGPVWGFYHEMGHNFQEGDWTFGGTGEVTNNLFSLYGSEKLNAITPDTYGLAHPNIDLPRSRERLKKYLADGAKFSEWTSDPFLALYMYAQLRQAFGWETFTKVFAEYRGLSNAERPKTDEAKHDQWMVRFSRAAGKNLGPFFQAWGVPTSDVARQSIASLPTWMPSDWPTK